jgi:transcriptional regulator with XRE-family HTH domain
MNAAVHPLRAWRKSQEPEVTLDDLGILLERAPGTVSRWETGQRMPHPDELLRISEITGIAIDVLIRAGQRLAAPQPEAAE